MASFPLKYTSNLDAYNYLRQLTYLYNMLEDSFIYMTNKNTFNINIYILPESDIYIHFN